ncbi:CotO family spore coat protein [Rossellomorea vietnamensis]|nr:MULTISPECIES: CotO family spore coat protein [Rossellomorea]
MKKNSKEPKKTPLLYIQQPAFKESRANMQQSYSSRDVKTTPVEKPFAEAGVKKPRRKKRSYFEDELGTLYGEDGAQENHDAIEGTKAETTETVDSIQEHKEKTYSFKPLKPFRDMELDEKITYLSRYINGKAPFPCEFITAEERYKGILLSSEGDLLVLKTFQGDEIEINRNSLRGIKIIGL